LQTQILSKYYLYALYDVVPVYGRTGSGCLTTTVGAGGVAAGTAVAEDCPVPAPAGSCDVGGASADVTTLATGTAFVSTISVALDKGTPRLTIVDRVSVPKATTGTDAAILLGGADIIPLDNIGRLLVSITPVYKGGAAGTGITLPGTQVGIGTGGATYRWVYDDMPVGR